MGAPLHESAGWQTRFAAALCDPEIDVPAGLKAWNGSDPARRFAVYRNNIAVNLVDGLCDTFPVCLALVGEDFFRAMAHVFVRQSPPRSKILARYGEAFADFVAAFELAGEITYLADVARLEYARVEAWHAADDKPMTASDWSGVDQDRLGQLRVKPHPSARVLASPFAVFSLWAAHQGALDIGDVDPFESEQVLILCPQLEVETIALPPGGAVFLGALAGEASLSEAAEQAAADSRFDLAANLAILMQSGFAVSAMP